MNDREILPVKGFTNTADVVHCCCGNYAQDHEYSIAGGLTPAWQTLVVYTAPRFHHLYCTNARYSVCCTVLRGYSQHLTWHYGSEHISEGRRRNTSRTPPTLRGSHSIALIFLSFLPLLAALALPPTLLALLALVGDLPQHVLLHDSLDLAGGLLLPPLQFGPGLLLQHRQRFRVLSRLLLLQAQRKNVKKTIVVGTNGRSLFVARTM